MNIMLVVILLIVIFNIGLILGVFLTHWRDKKAGYVGIMTIHDSEDGLKYTLELDAEPEELQYMKQIIFKVNSLD